MEMETHPTSPDDPFEPPPPAIAQPRLGIAHLMVWMAGSAAILATQRALGGWDEQPENYRTLHLAMTFPQSMVSGALVGSLAVGLTRLARGGPPLIHPGQWLAMLWGAMAIGAWGAYAVIRLANFHGDWAGSGGLGPLALLFALNAGLSLLMTAACLAAAIRGTFPPRWRIVFGVVAAEQGLTALSALFTAAMIVFRADFPHPAYMANQWRQMGGAWLAVIALTAAVVKDWRQAIGRDWMHWVGVAGVVWRAAATTLYAVWYLLAEWLA
jgi:hypothetical protein